jgi:hypothetical protein
MLSMGYEWIGRCLSGPLNGSGNPAGNMEGRDRMDRQSLDDLARTVVAHGKALKDVASSLAKALEALNRYKVDFDSLKERVEALEKQAIAESEAGQNQP